MELPRTSPVNIPIPDAGCVSGLLTMPGDPCALYVMAHGAGAGMTHPFMAAVASGLADRAIGTLRYQFPYMEKGSKRPDRPPVAGAAVRAAVEAAARLAPGLPVLAGGKSFGGRMTSQAQAEGPLPGVAGLVFFGFPLHPANQPGIERADHLGEVRIPMLFLQGDRDALAETGLLASVIDRLGGIAALHLLRGADHSFHVAGKSGRSGSGVLAEALDVMAGWARGTLAASAHGA